jgi:hypothetical protein
MGVSLNKFDYRLIYNNQNPKILEGMCIKYHSFFGIGFFEYLLREQKDIPYNLLLPLLKNQLIGDLHTIPSSLLSYNRDVPDFVLSYISKRGDTSYKTCCEYIKRGKIPPDIILRSMIKNNYTSVYDWDSYGKQKFMKFLDNLDTKTYEFVPFNIKKSTIDTLKNKIAEIEKEDNTKSYSQESFSFKSYFMR